jgi:hypothetical protein
MQDHIKTVGTGKVPFVETTEDLVLGVFYKVKDGYR